MDSLQVEMSGLLKELHCPSEELVSGILKGTLLKAKDHLKCLCTSSLLKFCGSSRAPFSMPMSALIFLLLLSSVPQLWTPGGSGCPMWARRKHTRQQSGLPGARGHVLHTEPTGSGGTGRCRSFISSQRGGKAHDLFLLNWPMQKVYWHLVVRNHIASRAMIRNMIVLSI